MRLRCGGLCSRVRLLLLWLLRLRDGHVVVLQLIERHSSSTTEQHTEEAGGKTEQEEVKGERANMQLATRSNNQSQSSVSTDPLCA